MKSLNRKDIMLITTCFSMMVIIFGSVNLSGLFIVPITEELDVSRSAFTLHMTVQTVSGILLNLMLSKILAVTKRRPLFVSAALACAAIQAGYGTATHLWHFYALSFLLGFATPFLLSTGTSVLINENFAVSIRGRIMGLVMAGSGLGTMILSPIMTQVILKAGWRAGYYLIAAMIVVLVVPQMLLFIRQPRGIPEESTEGMTPVEKLEHIDYPQPTGIGAFVAVMLGLISLVSGVLHSQMMPYSIELGIPETVASFIISLYAAFLIVGKIGLGAFCDKVGTRSGFNIVLLILLLSQVTAVAAGLMHFLFVPAVVLYGIGNTSSTVGITLFIAAVYGQENYNKVIGKYMACMNIGGLPTQVLGSFFFDTTGSYVPAFVVTSIASAVILACSIMTFHKVRRQRTQYLLDHPELMHRSVAADAK